MKEIRKKQKKLFKIMKIAVALALVYFVIYVGVTPYIESASAVAAIVCSYINDALVIACLAVVLVYYSKYGKSNAFLTRIEYEIKDCGFYYTQNTPKNRVEFINELVGSFKSNGFAVNSNVEYEELEFDYTAMKRKEFFYVVDVDSLSRDDVLAYLDVVVNDLTVRNLKRSGNCIICFVTDKAEDGAVALSKMVCTFGKKEQLKIAFAVVEPENSKCFFLGNMQTKCQRLVADYIMRSPTPIPDSLMHKERLPFQSELEEHMEEFTLKSFNDGTFYAH